MLKIILFLSVAFIAIVHNPFPTPKHRFFVYPGEPLTVIVDSLKAKGISVNRAMILALARILGWEREVKPGYYFVGQAEAPVQILMKFRKGGCDTVRVVIPEGFTLKQIGQRLLRYGLVNLDTFEILTHDQGFIKRLGFDEISTLEGLLFPDTYIFSIFDSEERVIEKMVRRFKEIAAHLEMPKSFYPTLILASIVEKEAKVDSERAIIASIFLKRLNSGRPLESCATVNYALGGHHKRLTHHDLRVNSPYNTYLYPGLPPTPICSPGFSSLKAVLTPRPTEYLYFVTNGKGGHYFSRTYKEHLKAKRRVNG
jgi:UPF0755 protein